MRSVRLVFGGLRRNVAISRLSGSGELISGVRSVRLVFGGLRINDAISLWSGSRELISDSPSLNFFMTSEVPKYLCPFNIISSNLLTPPFNLPNCSFANSGLTHTPGFVLTSHT